MATINADRIYAYGGSNHGAGPKRWVLMPVAASQTGRAGHIAGISSGLVTLSAAHATNTGIVGVYEGEEFTTAKSSGDLIPVTLATPFALFEGTLNLAQGRPVGTKHPFVENTTIDTAVLRSTVSSSADIGAVIVASLGAQYNYFETHRYIGKADTSETAGTDNFPLDDKKGGAADTDTRVAFVFGSSSLWAQD
jgi:hypothetical protein